MCLGRISFKVLSVDGDSRVREKTDQASEGNSCEQAPRNGSRI